MIEFRRSAIVNFLTVSVLAAGLTSCSGNGPSAAPTPTVASVTGSYVFAIAGTDPSDGDYFVLGRFTSDGKGNITSAVADYNLGSGIDADVPLTGTYTVAGGVATINLTDGGAIKDTLTASIVASGPATIQSFDGTGSGTLYPQTSGFAPAGNYSYTVKGEGQGTVTGSGQLVVGAGNTFSSGTLAYTDGPTTMNYSSVTGFVYPTDPNGRGQASLVGNNLAYYPISSSQVLMIGLDLRSLIFITAQKS